MGDTELMKAMLAQLQSQTEQLQTQNAQIQTQNDAIQVLLRERNERTSGEADSSGRRGASIDALEKQIRTFSYRPEEGITFDQWMERHREIFENEFSGLDDGEKGRVLLRKVDDKVDKQLRNHIRPKSPAELSFDEMISVMKELFGDKRSLFEKRLDLFQLKMSKLRCEDLTEFSGIVNRVYEDAQISDMKPEQFKAMILLSGIDLPRYTSTLFHVMSQIGEETPTVDSVLKVADSYRRVFGDAQAATGQSGQSSPAVNAVSKHNPKWNKSSNRESSKSGDNSRSRGSGCSRCGKEGHMEDGCPRINSECFKCHKKGHLSVMCNKWNQSSENHSRDKSCNMVFGDLTEGVQQFNAAVEMNGRVIEMLVDTGSDITLISDSTWREIGSPERSEHDAFPKCANGTPLELTGKCHLSLELNGIVAQGRVYTAKANTNILGRDFIVTFFRLVPKQITVNVIKKDDDKYVDWIMNEFPEICKGGLGKCKKSEASLTLKENATSIFCRRRETPLAMIPKVNEELDRLLEMEAIEPVDHLEWAAPILTVPKANGKWRVCVDFSTGLNDNLEPNKYPLPVMAEIFARLEGCSVFSQIDLSDAYLQIPVEENSRNLLGVNTHRGLFRFLRLPFGVSVAPGIFQKIMDTMMSGCENAQAYLDDIVIGGKTKDDHDKNLRKALMRIEEYGFHIRPEKCSFGLEQISYLGFIIDKSGRRPDPMKVKAVREMPEPQDQSSLRSFLGMVSYYGPFIKGMHKLRVPLDNLLKDGVEWDWSQECAKVFKEIRSVLASDLNLTHYDPEKELVLAADASEKGIGAVIAHRVNGRLIPIAHASRSLKPAEVKYAQIEKEGLGLIFGVTKFHRYLFGRKFVMQTDHKPLLWIFGSKTGVPAHTARRLYHWCTILLGYDFTMEYVNTESFAYADALSRLIADSRGEISKEDEIDEVERIVCNAVTCTLEKLPVTSKEIREESLKDPILCEVRSFHLSRWPDERKLKKNAFYTRIIPYWTKRKELAVANDCLMVGERVVIPSTLKSEVIKMLHAGHPGIVRMKSIGRQSCYWPGIDGDIEKCVQSCDECAAASKKPVKVPLEPWPETKSPWERIHLDYCGPVDGQNLLVMVDAFSKWPEIVSTTTMTAGVTIRILNESIARNGLPRVIVTDNGTQFNSEIFNRYCKQRGIQHLNSPAYHPQSNGQAERFVDTVKRSLQKQKGERPLEEALQTFLMNYRKTPNPQCDGKSPGEIFLGRRIRSEVDLMIPIPRIVSNNGSKSDPMKDQFDRKNGVKSKKIGMGDEVMYHMHVPPNGFKWTKGTVIGKRGKVMYEVQLENRKITAHANQLRLRKESDVEIEYEDARNEISRKEFEVYDDEVINELNESRDDVEDNTVPQSKEKEDAPIEPRRSTRARKQTEHFDIDPSKRSYRKE